MKVWDIRDQSPKTPVSQLDCLVRILHPHLNSNSSIIAVVVVVVVVIVVAIGPSK